MDELDAGDAKQVGLLSLARVSKAMVEPARRRLVYSIKYPCSPAGRQCLIRFLADRSYGPLIRRLEVDEEREIDEDEDSYGEDEEKPRSPIDAAELLEVICAAVSLRRLKLHASFALIDSLFYTLKATSILTMLSSLSFAYDDQAEEIEDADEDFTRRSVAAHWFLKLVRSSRDTLRSVEVRDLDGMAFPEPGDWNSAPLLRHIVADGDVGDTALLISYLLDISGCSDVRVRASVNLQAIEPQAARKVYELVQVPDLYPWTIDGFQHFDQLRRLRGWEISVDADEVISYGALPPRLEDLSICFSRMEALTALADQLATRSTLPALRILHVDFCLLDTSWWGQDWARDRLRPEHWPEVKTQLDRIRASCRMRNVQFSSKQKQIADLY